MAWRPLSAFHEPAIPKLDNLRRAAGAGLRVPPTFWTWAADLENPPRVAAPEFGARSAERAGGPLLVSRSASPTEDTARTSNAGQLVSALVWTPDEFSGALSQVIAALPGSGQGRRLGAVFVQPFIAAEAAGITFFDGFYVEETSAPGSNQALTAGHARGDVHRGQLHRGDPHHAWLLRVQRLFGGTIDVEWARPGPEGSEPVLLQVRPALFPIRRCETLSLANHKEILGDPPSPWMVGVLQEVSRPVMRFFERVDPAMAAWQEPYAIELAERAWLNFSAFFRLMDHWGLPRTFVTEGVGGEAEGPLDARPIPGRLLRSLPVFVRLAWACLGTLAGIRRGLRGLDAALARAETLRDLQQVNVRALEFSIRTNFAIMALLSGVNRVRRGLGLDQAASVVTQVMMAEYARLSARATTTERLRGLDAWLVQYGHRGPLESDPWRPRFVELRDRLEADLMRGPAPLPPLRPQPTRLLVLVTRPLFWLDEIRERFRDRLMRWWQGLRLRILSAAGRAVRDGVLEAVDDAFFLRGDDLAADPATWRERVAARRAARRWAMDLDLPATAPRDVIEAAIARSACCVEPAGRGRGGGRRFTGIGLGAGPVHGTAVRAAELTEILDPARTLPASSILVVETLEPSWAVVFSRFAAVVASLGGELSHASILLRETGIPAVVNARGAAAAIVDGDLLVVDPTRGEVRIETRPGPSMQEGKNSDLSTSVPGADTPPPGLKNGHADPALTPPLTPAERLSDQSPRG